MTKRGLRLKKGAGVSGICDIIAGHYETKLKGQALKLLGSPEFWASCLRSAGESPEAALGRQHRAALERGRESEEAGLHALTKGLHQGFVGLWGTEAGKRGSAVGVVAGLGQTSTIAHAAVTICQRDCSAMSGADVVDDATRA
eukprot:2091511-Rhodomonas_salina.3